MRDEVRVAWADSPHARALKGTWLERSAMQAAQARVVADAVLATGEDAPPDPRARAGDGIRMRGVPIVGRGVRGAMKGSSPEDALHRLDG
jgi:hypothetical protein